jgi:hypothetical protein
MPELEPTRTLLARGPGSAGGRARQVELGLARALAIYGSLAEAARARGDFDLAAVFDRRARRIADAFTVDRRPSHVL